MLEWLIFSKTDYSGDISEAARLKHSGRDVYFDVCNDTIYAAVDVFDENGGNSFGRGGQVIKRVSKHEIEDFLEFKGFSHLGGADLGSFVWAIQATSWIVAILIYEKDGKTAANFYTLDGQLLLSVREKFRNIFKVANGAFVLTANDASHLYMWDKKPDGSGAFHSATKILDKGITWVQPKLDF